MLKMSNIKVIEIPKGMKKESATEKNFPKL